MAKTKNTKPATIELAAGERAFNKLRSRLVDIPKEELVNVNVDVQVASLVALGVARDIESDAPLRARLEALGKAADFDVSSVHDLAEVALATWYTGHAALLASATSKEAQLPGSLVTTATVLKTRMMRVVEYHLGDHESAGRVVAVIRAGVGYLDLANDLIALSRLYATYRDEIAHDGRNYSSGDEKAARETGDQILELLGAKSTPEARKWMDLQARAFSLLTQVYDEVQAGVLFLFRKDRTEAERRVPSLVSASRASVSRSSARTASPETTGSESGQGTAHDADG